MRNIFRHGRRPSNVIGIIVLILSVGFLFHQAWAQQASIPSDLEFPSDIKIIPPDPSIPKEIAAFSGVWVGKWQNGRNHALIVKEIKGNTAEVIYLWGIDPQTFGSRSGSRSTSGTFANGQLKVSLAGKYDAYYKLADDGTLSGSWESGWNGNQMPGQLHRIQYP